MDYVEEGIRAVGWGRRKWLKNYVKKIEADELIEGEELLAVATQIGGMLKNILFLTNKRILTYEINKVITTGIKEIPLKSVTSYQFDEKILVYDISIKAKNSSDIEVKRVSAPIAKFIKRKLIEQVLS